MWRLTSRSDIAAAQFYLCVARSPGNVPFITSHICACLQMIVSANGHHKVPFVDLIVAGKIGWKVSTPAFG
jgi:hypothetical protein